MPIRVGVEDRVDILSGGDARDIAFVDVDFDLERVHVDDGADAGAREAAARGDGRDHLAGLGVLRDGDAAERRANDVVGQRRLLHLGLLLGDANLLLQRPNPRIERVGFRPCVVEL